MDPRTGGDIYLFYQWNDNGLRYISQSPKRVWQGSTDLHVTDAKPGTPLTSVSTISNGSTLVSNLPCGRCLAKSEQWWLFYVDSTNVIQNIYSRNDPTTWRKGNVGSNRYKVPSQTSIAFTISRGRKYNTTINDLDGGISLYAAGTDGTIHEYIFDDENGAWSNGFTFPNTDGFSGASTWSTGSSAFFYAESSSQSLELWFRNYDSISDDNGNRWQLGPSSTASLMENGSMSGQYGIAFQSSSGVIQGSNFTTYVNPKNTRWDTTYNISDQAAIDGSAVSCWFFFPTAGVKSNIMFQVFYQTDENSIEEAVRTWGPDNHTVPGTWSYNSLPI